MTFGQAIASCICALVYLTIEATRTKGTGRAGSSVSFAQIVGWRGLKEEQQPTEKEVKNGKAVNGTTSEKTGSQSSAVGQSKAKRSLLGLLLQTAICQTMASPFGFMSLRYISYPTMVLAKVSQLPLDWSYEHSF